MNTSQVNVDHHDGIIFQKVEADSGITYMAINPEEVTVLDRSLLVRHGRPETGRCGYYPLYLLLESEAFRFRKAASLGKRPPKLEWVEKTRKQLADAGVAILLH